MSVLLDKPFPSINVALFLIKYKNTLVFAMYRDIWDRKTCIKQ